MMHELGNTGATLKHLSSFLLMLGPLGLRGDWGEVESITVPAKDRGIAEARAFVAAQARGHVSDVACAVLLTSELVTNVVRHARTDATITVDVGPPFRVEVHDGA